MLSRVCEIFLYVIINLSYRKKIIDYKKHNKKYAKNGNL